MGKIGLILFFGSLAVLILYAVFVYIPALQTNITNINTIINGALVALGCGIVGFIGIVIARQK